MPGSGSANDYAAGGYDSPAAPPMQLPLHPSSGPASTYTQYNENTQEYKTGNGLIGTLGSAGNNVKAGDTFTWGYTPPSAYGDTSQWTNMTMAGALGWLKEMSVTNKDQYNEVIGTLVQAGYITPTQARYNTWSTDMGAAFLRSAVDVMQTNAGQDGGQLTTWWNYMDQTIQGRLQSGQLNPDGTTGAGSAGAAALQRVDKFTPIENVQNAIQNASENALGRRLTDAEVQAFASAYHGLEQTWNDQAWAAKQKDPNEAYLVSTTTHPDVAAQADNFMQTDPQFTQERDTQRVGSYIGILRDMMGVSPMPRAGVSNQLLNQ